ncbi:MAG: hypothetical protein H7Y61_13245 [Rhizobiales bacterium]|nr:hypothetical protein [Rhizobacter sp.]
MSGTKSKTDSSKAPWERENPKPAKGEKHKTLSPAAKASAKRHAKAAGRPYPNLVDNMRAARQGKAKPK